MSDKGLNDWAYHCWKNAEDHGFHTNGVNDTMPAWIANIHGELSELWEAYRKGTLNKPCDKKGCDLTCAAEEVADIIIRTFDMAQQMGIDVEYAVRTKHEYNVGRPYLHGGKKA